MYLLLPEGEGLYSWGAYVYMCISYVNRYFKIVLRWSKLQVLLLLLQYDSFAYKNDITI